MKRSKFLLFLLVLFALCLVGCGENTVDEPSDDPTGDDPKTADCTHEHSTWVWDEDAKCNRNNTMFLICDDCKEVLEEKQEFKDHDFVEEITEPTCTEPGNVHKACKNCTLTTDKAIPATGHEYEYKIDKVATAEEYGIKHEECVHCGAKEKEFEYVNNGVSAHGQLSVKGTFLIDEHGDKVVLAGISTHGLQWCGQFINFDTFKALRNEWGINVIRLACYPDEGGYSTGSKETQAKIYQRVVDGITFCTELDMYVIVDWHMLSDGFYTDDAALFFAKIAKQFKDNNNILYEVMNEPSRNATWQDCKDHANRCVPVIRNYQPDAVCLIGNPKFSADLESCIADPLPYKNIMYTFHFYAHDSSTDRGTSGGASKITNAINKKLPVFISEHGGMNEDGDGPIDKESVTKWYEVVDKNNLSFVAWNLSNTACSASIFKTTTKTTSDFSDELMKEWGPYYRDRVRTVMGLPVKTKN